MIGSWTEGGKSFPASFKRADYRAEHAWDNEKDYSFSSANDLQGHWKGSYATTIAKKKASISLALDIAKMPDGSYAATASYPNLLGNNDPVPCSDFEYNPPNLNLKLRLWKSNYKGTLKNGKLMGVWHQGLRSTFPVTFERTGSP